MVHRDEGTRSPPTPTGLNLNSKDTAAIRTQDKINLVSLVWSFPALCKFKISRCVRVGVLLCCPICHPVQLIVSKCINQIIIILIPSPAVMSRRKTADGVKTLIESLPGVDSPGQAPVLEREVFY